MAKKRVHEIAKEKGIPSKEVLAKLQAAGFDVKAAASSVDEADIEQAFGDGQPASANGEPAAEPEQAPQAADGAKDGGSQGGARRERPRPTRGESGPGAGGRRRRVVIDSQAGRGRPGGPPPPQQPVRRGRGRRRRPQWVEPDLTKPPEEPVEQPPTEIQSGATVGQVAESLGLSPAEV